MPPIEGAPDVVEDVSEALSRSTAVVVEDEEPGKKGLPARAALNADGTVTLQLVKPVVLTISKGGQERSETFAELTFRELTGADLRVVAQEKPSSLIRRMAFVMSCAEYVMACSGL